MTDEEKRDRVLRRLTRTGRGETICLADWEVEVILNYIYELERKAVERND